MALGLALGGSANASTSALTPVNTPSPESEVNVTGTPFTGTDADGNVRGFVDTHTHQFSADGFGGDVVCGQVFSNEGIADALQDCAGHQPDGSRALIENLTRTGSPTGTHDPVGWPTFNDWPAYDSLTHQQMYYKWVERAWRGGQRIMVNHLVSNSGLCQVNALTGGTNKYPCDDMDAVRREAARAYELEAFIDAQFGGPGKGWYRIVTTPEQARQVIIEGKLAVILGVEVSEPFGCKQTLGIPGCTKAQIDRGLDELHELGVRSMFLCHKFDNALCGVRYDEGTNGIIVNVGQFITTGTWWNPQTCAAGQVQTDHTVVGGVLPKEFSAIMPAGALLPVYPVGPHCNPRGLTDLGEYALKGLMSRGMILEIDHMSVKAADRALDILESAFYPGVVSSHSWMDKTYIDRLYALGGFVSSYGHSTDEYIAEWQSAQDQRAEYDKGWGYGMDMNGFGGTPAPPTSAGITYPFRSFDGGSVLDRQVTGERVFDYNEDGVPHYGLVPDWVEDLRLVGGQSLIDDLARGAQDYLDTYAATATYAPGANLAKGKPAWASSQEWSLFTSYAASRAFDGRLDTRWASKWADNQWLKVDLGDVRPIGRIVIDWERAYASSFRVQFSNDGQTWRDVETVSGTNGTQTRRYTDESARWVRLMLDKRATSWGYSIKELSIFS